ncbi:hypothetical protein [Brevibacterium senegalense]|nr:hypothetical protein [Brevibacterium senegalense]
MHVVVHAERRTPAQRPDPQPYVMYPRHIADDGSFSIAAAVWDVG